VVRARHGGEYCDSRCAADVRRTVGDTLAAALREGVRDLVQPGADALLIDLTGNGGGTEWVSKAARVITPHAIPGEPSAFVRTETFAREFERSLGQLDRVLSTPLASPWGDSVRAARTRVAAAVTQARTTCDRSHVWTTGLTAATCNGLVTGLWTTGASPWIDPALARGQPGATEVYNLAESPITGGVWAGPIVLVIDGATASASEHFAAELMDGAGAAAVGVRTYGAGCGYAGRAESAYLPATGLLVRAPNCARFRRDGTNEVAGIGPTLDAGWTQGDGGAARAEKVVSAALRMLSVRPASRN
jgi:Peptidase family S41